MTSDQEWTTSWKLDVYLHIELKTTKIYGLYRNAICVRVFEEFRRQ